MNFALNAMSIVPILKSREILKLLLQLGFKIISQKGSHIKLEHIIDRTRKVILPFHNRDLKRGTHQSILKQAKIPLKEFLKLLGN